MSTQAGGRESLGFTKLDQKNYLRSRRMSKLAYGEAGMKSTQLSESFNASLKNYLRSDHDLMQFLMHFERLLSNKRHKELEAEFALSQKQPKVLVPYKVLVQAGKIYTRDICEAFQVEYFKSVVLQVRCDVEDDENIIYMVCNDDGRGVVHVKRYKSNDHLSCSCRLFEMSGILCRHALKVFREVLLGGELPDQYILKRWTRDARSTDVHDMLARNTEANGKLEEADRYSMMMTGWRKLADRAAKYEDAYHCVIETQITLQAKLEAVIHAHLNRKVQETVTAHETAST
ncbi:hypothetical protein L1049_000105 [Liquidambar formosana]|uniref:Protein FAR1-RELATED SEQUENCE n=1 Tax=Liquidambar formosana TaxID=63359 RepID=A0AAP0NAG8_LIQFO